MDDQNTAMHDEELATLKARADIMGIAYKSNIGLETLRERVRMKLENTTTDEQAEAVEEAEEEINEDEQEEEQEEVVAQVQAPVRVKDIRSKDQRVRDELRAESLALVRCKIYNLNPNKRDLDGEIITVANRYIGTVAKFIPFGEATDNGYHIPRVLYNELRDRKFQSLSSKKDKNDQEELVRRMVPEYNIEVMAALTSEELHDLALKQAAAARMAG